MDNNFETLEDFINKGASNDELASFFYNGSKYLELLHQNGRYATNFNPKHIVSTGKSVIFERTDIITNRIIGDEVKSNIEAYNSLMVGCYINYTKSLLPYSKLREYFNDINYAFREEDKEYFRRSIEEGEIMYYHHYVDNMNKFLSNPNNMSSSRKYVNVKSTPQGRAMSEAEPYSQAAFANVLIVAAIVCLIMLVAIVTYMILK